MSAPAASATCGLSISRFVHSHDHEQHPHTKLASQSSVLFLACLWTAVACAAGDVSNDGELLYNGIRLPREWPPHGRVGGHSRGRGQDGDCWAKRIDL